MYLHPLRYGNRWHITKHRFCQMRARMGAALGHSPLIQSATMDTQPLILCLGGLDPTGGAGIQADIETLGALGTRPLTLATALTAQDTANVDAILPTPVDFFTRQLEVLLNDIRPDAIKIGLLGSDQLLLPIRRLLEDFDGPVVLDPILRAGGGFETSDHALRQRLNQEILPLITLVTPNRSEARRLSGDQQHPVAAAALLDAGAAAVLVTGADEAMGETLCNTLYMPGREPEDFSWPRLPNSYHGSGCTLASACVARLALGDDLPTAVATAQTYVWQVLESATKIGRGQLLPGRFA